MLPKRVSLLLSLLTFSLTFCPLRSHHSKPASPDLEHEEDYVIPEDKEQMNEEYVNKSPGDSEMDEFPPPPGGIPPPPPGGMPPPPPGGIPPPPNKLPSAKDISIAPPPPPRKPDLTPPKFDKKDLPTEKELQKDATPSLQGLPDPKKDPMTNLNAMKQGPALQWNENAVVDKVLLEMRKELNKEGANDVPIPRIKDRVEDKEFIAENGTIRDLDDVHRVGNATATTGIKDAMISCAFAFYNVTGDEDIEIEMEKDPQRMSRGNIDFMLDNTTSYQVFKFTYATQDLTLDQYELTMGEITFNATGFEKNSKKESAILTKVVKKTKGPMLKAASAAIKTAINVALKAAKTALFSPKG